MKKLVKIAVIAGVGYLVVKKVKEIRDEIRKAEEQAELDAVMEELNKEENEVKADDEISADIDEGIEDNEMEEDVEVEGFDRFWISLDKMLDVRDKYFNIFWVAIHVYNICIGNYDMIKLLVKFDVIMGALSWAVNRFYKAA